MKSSELFSDDVSYALPSSIQQEPVADGRKLLHILGSAAAAAMSKNFVHFGLICFEDQVSESTRFIVLMSSQLS